MKESSEDKEKNRTKTKFPKYKDYLDKTYLEELAYKIWATKGARNIANKRLLQKNDLSTRAQAFLSAYLIIIGLISVYKISNVGLFSDNVVAFGTTTLSILLLVFSQIEAAQDFKLKAKNFSECSLRLAEIHSKIRIFKTLKVPSEEEKILFSNELNKEYMEVLCQYDNHDSIDYQIFMTQYKTYYELSFARIILIHIKYYIQTKLLYHFLIVSPFLAFLLIYLRARP